MRTKVIHLGTGLTGKPALRNILLDPSLELVGWWVTDPSKIGVDAGQFCGLPSAGVVGTTDIEALLALDAGCLFYAGHSLQREVEACTDIARFLERGTNVVTFTIIAMIYPPSSPANLRKIVDDACKKGNSTFYASGTEPGMLTMTLPAALLSGAGRIDRYVEEMHVVDMIKTYPVESTLRNSMGFGGEVGTMPIRYKQSTAMDWWKPNIYVVADHMNVKVEDFRFKFESAPLEHDVDSKIGRFDKGTVGSWRWILDGIVNGEPRISIYYMAKLTTDSFMPADWARPAADTKDSALVYKIFGDPSYKNQIYLDTPPGGTNASVDMTGLHCVNAIPHVVAAAPGVISALDLPYYFSRIPSFGS